MPGKSQRPQHGRREAAPAPKDSQRPQHGERESARIPKDFQATAAVGHCLVRPTNGSSEAKGVCLAATRAVQPGEALLVERPLLHTLAPSLQYEMRLRMLAAHLEHSVGASDAEVQAVKDIAMQKAPTLRSFATAPADVREKVLGLQTEFSETASTVARATCQVANQLHAAGLFSGTGGRSEDDLFAGGHALTEAETAAVLTCSLVNSFDMMPEGSSAIFYMGSLFEHSCTPNARFHIVASLEESSDGWRWPTEKERWVGEWRALRAIAAGEAVRVSYLEDSWLSCDREARRQKLLKRMGFICRCARCEQPEAEVDQDVDARSTSPISWADTTIRKICSGALRQDR
eukprot:gnl/TRDRNA2_/TRDRNA2_87176_c0_seq1.p1 gnl/TRDRNA2_/TRDRNA2_87176_c0~~gnl/TRDRNA2_/TRDRNA2_87176_c0_seq1.p1  ORF type:complete len:346 (-),score=74.70 gnl/TRDRNA2_/TRDRNA2_87176_c0_seq1:33-1070(-)